MAFLTTCTCCGAELDNVQFYEGNAYGSTCVLKVDPQYKVNKKAKWIEAEYKDLVGGNYRAGLWYKVKVLDKWMAVMRTSKKVNIKNETMCFYNNY